MIQRACECGATVKIADLNGKTEEAVLEVWDQLHEDHEEVAPFIATRIRDGERKRLKSAS